MSERGGVARFVGALLLLAAIVPGGSAGAEEPVQPQPQPQPQVAPALPPEPVGTVERDVLEGGPHQRLVTAHGVVHLWRPAHFDQRTAGTLVYVHGYYTSADEAFVQHRLAAQFAASQRNALFIVPEAPVGNGDTVRFEELGALLATVQRLARIRIPDGPLVAMGHSGAFRTIVPWLAFARLDRVLLVDAVYSGEDELVAWMTTHERAAKHKLVLVSTETVARADGICARIPGCVQRDGIPEAATGLTSRERHARLLHLRTEIDHMELVTGRTVIPLLLHLSALPSL